MGTKKARVIARLDVKDENLVKGIQLEGLRKLGPPNDFARKYYASGIDEILYIDIVASLYNRNNLSDIVRKTCEEIFIPVTVGGGLRSVEDVRHILSMGADKAAIEDAIKTMPNYFSDYDTTVTFITAEEMQKNHAELPHGGFVIRTGKTGLNKEHTHTIEYSLKLDSNPEFTSSALIAFARAIDRKAKRGETGCRTVFDVAPADLSPLSGDELRAHML